MKRFGAVALLLLGLAPAEAQSVTTAGALTKTACYPPGHSAGQYQAGTEVGVIVTFYDVFRGSGPKYGGRLMSVSLTSKTPITSSGFKLYQFWHPPFNTLGPGSGATVYGQDNINRAIGRVSSANDPNDYWAIVATVPRALHRRQILLYA